MRVDLGLIMGIALEYVLMVYYANTTLYPKKNYIQSSIAALVGYAVLLGINIVGYPLLSVTAFFVINFVLLKLFYNIGIKAALFTSLFLDLFSTVGEYIMAFSLDISYNIMSQTVISPYESIVLTVASKLIYFVGLLIVKRLKKKDNRAYDGSMNILLAIPLITIICLTVLLHDQISGYIFWTICISFMAVNIITFSVNEIVIRKNAELQRIKDETAKYKLTAAEYQIISDQYEKMRVLKHDYKKQMRAVSALVGDDNGQAQKYLTELQNKYEKNDYVKYTDNVILNMILLSTVKLCKKKKIELNISAACERYGFISKTDTAAIFSNLIENAVEACERSDEKYISVDLYAANGIFPSVKIENSSDIEPLYDKNGFISNKKDGKDHGLGMRSVKTAVEEYSGVFDWSYNKERKIFRVSVIFNPDSDDNDPSL